MVRAVAVVALQRGSGNRFGTSLQAVQYAACQVARCTETRFDNPPPQSVDQQGANFGGVAETDLGLGRVHIHIHRFRRHVEPEHHDGMAVGCQHGTVGCADHTRELSVSHWATVYKEVLRQRIGFVEGRQTRPAAQRDTIADAHDLPAVGGKVCAHDIAHPVGSIGAAGQGEGAFAVVLNVKAQGRMRQGQTADDVKTSAGLSLLALEELQPRRDREEEVGDVDGRACV